jgi:alpha-D-xyloside xylohydrolase
VHGFDSLPVLVRPGTVLPIGAHDAGPEYDYAECVALHLYEPAALTQASVRVGDVNFSLRRDGRELTVHGPDPAEKAWSVVRQADEKSGGSASTRPASSASVTLTLPDAAQ